MFVEELAASLNALSMSLVSIEWRTSGRRQNVAKTSNQRLSIVHSVKREFSNTYPYLIAFDLTLPNNPRDERLFTKQQNVLDDTSPTFREIDFEAGMAM